MLIGPCNIALWTCQLSRAHRKCIIRIRLESFLKIFPSSPLPAVDLSTALDPETMVPILANPDVQARLVPFLPEGESLPQSEDELRATISAPQFKQVGNHFLCRSLEEKALHWDLFVRLSRKFNRLSVVSDLGLC